MDLDLTKKALLLEKYQNNLRHQGKSEATISTYHCYVKKFFIWLQAEKITHLQEVTRETIDAYRESIFNQTEPVLSLRSQQLYLVSLRSFYYYLTKQNYILYNPTSHIELPKVPKTLPRTILSESQINKLLNIPKLDTPLGLRDRAMLEVLYSTGMRNTELRCLHINDVDFENATMRIDQGKGGKPRIVPLGEIASSYVREYIRIARPKLIRIHNPSSQLLFISIFGKKLDPTALSYIIQKYLPQAKIKERIGAHTLRHTMATHLLNHNAPLRCIQQLLGHTSLDTTQRYLHIAITDLKKTHKKSHPREQDL